MYEYKCDFIDANVTDKDIRKGSAGSKVTGQVELKLSEWNERGWEFHRSEVIDVSIKDTGC